MPNYEVGNLEIKFSALNEIDFEKLKDGLNKVKSAINNIGKIDTGRLDNFSKILSDLSTKFLPFLQGVEKASGGLAVFNDTLRQVGGRGGARGLSVAVAEFENIKKYTQEEVAIAEQLGVNLREATEEQLAQIQAIIENNRRLEEQRRITEELSREYSLYQNEFYRASRTKPEILHDIELQKQGIQEIQNDLLYLKQQFVSLGAPEFFDDETRARAQELSQNIQLVSAELSNAQSSLADLQAQFGAPFNEAQRAVSALKNELLNVYYATHTINEQQVQQAQELINKINETQRAIDRRFMSTQEQVIADQKEAIAKNQLEIAYLKAQMGLGKLNMTQEQYLAELQRLEAEQRRLRGELEETNDTQKDTEKQTKKTTSGWKKFLNQIKRIAIYRLIRTALRAIVSTFRDTINAFAEVDDGVNNTMSNITSSFSIIKLGFGSTILPLLQIIEPIVQQIAMGFANMGNTISQAMSTTSKYTKINTDYIKNYRDELEKTQGSLLDFDKFRVLNQGQDSGLSGFLLADQDVEENNEHVAQVRLTIESLKKTILGVWEVIKGVWDAVSPILTTALRILNDTIIPAVSTLVDWIGKFVGWLNKTGLLEPVLYAIAAGFIAIKATKIVDWVKNLGKTIKDATGKFNLWYLAIAAVATAIGIISNWDNFSKGTKQVITIIAALTAALTAAAVAAMALHGSLTLGTAVPLIITAVAAGAVAIKGFTDPATFAQGGLPDRGTLFYAGEAGAEMVYNMPSGQSGVANVTQIEQAFYNALVRYGKENRSVGGGQTVVEIDGQAVFRAVDRAAGQRGLGFARK